MDLLQFLPTCLTEEASREGHTGLHEGAPVLSPGEQLLHPLWCLSQVTRTRSKRSQGQEGTPEQGWVLCTGGCKGDGREDLSRTKRGRKEGEGEAAKDEIKAVLGGTHQEALEHEQQ